MVSSLLFALARAEAHVQKVKRRPGQLATLTPPARDDRRLHVLITGTSPIPAVFLVPPGDEPLRQEGTQWIASPDIVAETALMMCAHHSVTITADDVRHALRAPVDQDSLSASGMSAVVLCPSAPDWPREWQSIEIVDGVVGETYRPPSNQTIDAMVKAAVMNRGRYQYDTWVRPDWRF